MSLRTIDLLNGYRFVRTVSILSTLCLCGSLVGCTTLELPDEGADSSADSNEPVDEPGDTPDEPDEPDEPVEPVEVELTCADDGVRAVTGDLGGFLTVQEAIDAADVGGRVELCDGAFKESVTIEKDLELVSQYDTVLRGQKNRAAIAIIGADVTLEGLMLTEGSGWKYTSNGVTQAFGGAVMVADAESFTMKNCIVEANTADFGGGLYLEAVERVRVEDTEFFSNSSTQGGAVYAYKVDAADFIDVTLRSNFASEVGGAIFTYTSTLSLDQVLAESNEAGSGGGVYFYDSFVDVANTTLRSNGALYGGGAMADNSTLNLLGGVEIARNVAQEVGGGVYVMTASEFSMIGGELSNNEAKDAGGLFVYEAAATLSGDVEVSDNASTGSIGGGIVAYTDSTLSISGGEITDNTGAQGAGLYTTGATVELFDVSINNNEADYFGGGLFVGWDSQVTMIGGELDQNSAETGGGGALVESSTFSLQNVDATMNKGPDEGGAIAAYSSTIELSNVLFQHNNALEGAALYLDDSEAVLTSNVEILNNSAAYKGGAAFVTNLSNFSMNGGMLRENEAGYGGGLFVEGSVADLRYVDLSEHFATYHGGAAYVREGAILYSETSDWASGTTDNESDDIFINDPNSTYLGIGRSYTLLGNDESFTCSGDRCG